MAKLRTMELLSVCFLLVRFTVSEEVSIPTALSVFTRLEFEPESPKHIFEGDLRLINVTYNATTGKGDSAFLMPNLIADYHMERARLISNHTLEFKYIDGVWECQNNCSVEVYGVFLGEAEIEFLECRKNCSENNFYPIPDRYEVYVIRKSGALDTLFTVVLVMFGCVANLGMGCKIDLDVVKETLKKPIGPAVGFFCQFLFMPVLAFAFTKALSLPSTESIGLFSNGCSPGGGTSNMWTLLLGGDLSLSITMTTVSTFAALGMFPFWMYTLGRLIIGKSFRIAFENIIFSLVGIVIPSAVGIIIKRFRPKVAKIIGKSLKPLSLILIIFMFTVGIYINLYIFKLFTPKLVIAGICLPWSGFICGMVVSIIARRKKKDVIAITLETGIQNIGVAVMTLKLSLPQPQNDLSIVGAIVPSMFVSFPLIVVYVCYLIVNRCFKTKNVELEKDPMPSDDCPDTPTSVRSTVFLTTPITRRKSMAW